MNAALKKLIAITILSCPVALMQAQSAFSDTPDPLAGIPGLRKISQSIPHRHSRDIGKGFVGIGFETLDRDTFDPSKTFDLLGESGVKYARCQTGWMKCEKKVGKYDFAWLDEVVDGLSAQGIETWFSVSFGHPHYTPCAQYDSLLAVAAAKGEIAPGRPRGYVGESPYYHGEEAMKGWFRYVRALAKHFKGRVTVWEVWNEPEGFWLYQAQRAGTLYGVEKAAHDFADFVRVTADEIHKVIPDALISIDLCHTGSAWRPALAEAGIADVIDIFNYHVYNRTPEENLRMSLDQTKALFVRHDGKPVRIWQGESGYPTGPALEAYGILGEYGQAKFIARRLMMDAACGAEMSSIFSVTDFLSYYPDGSDQYYGVINGRENKPKPGYYTMQLLASLLEDIEPAPENFIRFTTPKTQRTMTSLLAYNAIETVSLKKKGIPVLAFWQKEHLDLNAHPLKGMLQVVTGVSSKFTVPIIIDPVRRTVWDASALKRMYPHGVETFQPLFCVDYPLILTDLSILKLMR